MVNIDDMSTDSIKAVLARREKEEQDKNELKVVNGSVGTEVKLNGALIVGFFDEDQIKEDGEIMYFNKVAGKKFILCKGRTSTADGLVLKLVDE